MDIIYIGALIAVAGAAISAIGTRMHNKSSSLKTDSIKKTGENTYSNTNTIIEKNKELESTISKQKDELVEVYQKLTSANTILASKSEEIKETQNKLIKAQEENSKLQSELLNQNTSKESRPILTMATNQSLFFEGIYILSVYNDGKYPITGIKVYFEDNYTPLEKLPLPDIEFNRAEGKAHFQMDMARHNQTVDVGALSKGEYIKSIYRFVITDMTMDFLNFEFRVTWKDGSYTCKGSFKNPRKYKYNETPKDNRTWYPEPNVFYFVDGHGIDFTPNPQTTEQRKGVEKIF